MYCTHLFAPFLYCVTTNNFETHVGSMNYELAYHRVPTLLHCKKKLRNQTFKMSDRVRKIAFYTSIPNSVSTVHQNERL